MKNRFSLTQKLWGLSAVLVASILLVGGIGYYFSQQLSRHVDLLGERDVPMVRKSTLVDMMHDGLRAVVYSAFYDASTGSANLKEIVGEYKEFSDNMAKYMGDVSAIPGLPDNVKVIIKGMEPEITAYLGAGQAVLDHIVNRDILKAKKQMPAFIASFETLEKSLGEFGDILVALSEEELKEANSTQELVNFANILVVVIGAITGIFMSFFIVRGLVRDLTQVTKQLTEQATKVKYVASNIDTSAEKLSSTSTQQASAIHETVSSMEEMAAMLSQTSASSIKATEITDQGKLEATHGNDVVAKMLTAMEEVQHTNSNLQGLVDVIKEIQNKTTVINDIVFETRLLSFNASIEAARAGVHGKGFAVVAEEVGKLAAMSGKAADEIRDLLESSTKEVSTAVKTTQQKVDAGRVISEDCAKAFRSMGGVLDNIAGAVKTIVCATKEQEAGVNQTNQAMNEMDKVTQINSASSESLAQSARELAVGSTALFNVLQDMQLIVWGNRGAKGSRSVPSKANPTLAHGPETTNHNAGSRSGPSEAPHKSKPIKIESAKGPPSRSDSRWKSAS